MGEPTAMIDAAKKRERYRRWVAKPEVREQRNAYMREYKRRYRAAGRDKWRRSRREYLRKMRNRYGVTEAQFDAMLVVQTGRCAICREPMNPRTSAPHVDHCHRTGRVRGLLCMLCNHGLGSFRDSPDALQRAIEYLRQPLA